MTLRARPSPRRAYAAHDASRAYGGEPHLPGAAGWRAPVGARGETAQTARAVQHAAVAGGAREDKLTRVQKLVQVRAPARSSTRSA